jgi:hypothetical protein
VLIALQIALTLAIVCNAMFIIQQRVDMVHRPTGINEENLFLVTKQWAVPRTDNPATPEKLDSAARPIWPRAQPAGVLRCRSPAAYCFVPRWDNFIT